VFSHIPHGKVGFAPLEGKGFSTSLLSTYRSSSASIAICFETCSRTDACKGWYTHVAAMSHYDPSWHAMRRLLHWLGDNLARDPTASGKRARDQVARELAHVSEQAQELSGEELKAELKK
jgi:hypothetical protein